MTAPDPAAIHAAGLLRQIGMFVEFNRDNKEQVWTVTLKKRMTNKGLVKFSQAFKGAGK